MKPKSYIVETQFVNGSARFCTKDLAQANHLFSEQINREGVISVSISELFD